MTTTRRVLAFVVMATAGVLVAVNAAATASEVSSTALPARPKHVVVFGFDHVGLADIGRGQTPNLDRLARVGAVAATNIRTLAYRSTTDAGYASLGASARVSTDAHSAIAYDRTGAPGVVVLGTAATRRVVAGLHLSSQVGALGHALHAAGLRTAAVGNGDSPASGESTAPPIFRPAALAVMDLGGTIDDGAVNRRDVLEPDAEAPYGVRADPAAVEAAVREAVSSAAVVVVDPGDLDRAAAFADSATPGPALAQRRAALRRTDAILGRLVAMLPRSDLLIVTAASRPGTQSYLAPTVFSGAGIRPGYLMSPSTKRLGVMTITDLAPTILSTLGVGPAKGMIGRPLRVHDGAVSMGLLHRLDRDTASREASYLPMTDTFIVLLALCYLVAVSRRRPSRPLGSMVTRVAAVATAAFPLATFAWRWLSLDGRSIAGVAALLCIEALVVVLALQRRGDELQPLTFVTGATVVVLVFDAATGGHLQVSSWLGYSLYGAGRFYGLPNTTYAVLASSALVWACVLVWRSRERSEMPLAAVAAFVVVTVVLASPTLGANVGAILTLVPVLGVTSWVLLGRSVSWRAMVSVSLACAAVLVAVFAIDALRPAASRTHIGTFVSSMHGGPGVLLTTIARKELANLRIARSSVWTWVLPIAAVGMGWMLRSRERRALLIPPGSALRVCAVSAAALAVVGLGTSDSGPVFVGLVFVYLGPLFVLRDLADQSTAAEGRRAPALARTWQEPPVATANQSPGVRSASRDE